MHRRVSLLQSLFISSYKTCLTYHLIVFGIALLRINDKTVCYEQGNESLELIRVVDFEIFRNLLSVSISIFICKTIS